MSKFKVGDTINLHNNTLTILSIHEEESPDDYEYTVQYDNGTKKRISEFYLNKYSISKNSSSKGGKRKTRKGKGKKGRKSRKSRK